MEITGTTLPGYKICEYLLVLNPHEELAEKIAAVRNDFNTEFKTDQKTGWRPNLALARFMQYEMMEERIVNRLNTVAIGHYPFKVELKDFGSFPSHTIFINVTNKLPVQDLTKAVRTETQRMMKLNDDNKPYFILEPHIIVAMKLKPWQYEAGSLKYSQKDFTGRFIADSILLLKRQHREKTWQIRKRFELLNMPVNTKQGELFG
jgi:2'-5' RNA ligase